LMYAAYNDLGNEPATTGFGRFTVDQLLTNTCPEVPPFHRYALTPGRSMAGTQYLQQWRLSPWNNPANWAPADSGTTRGPDGAFMSFYSYGVPNVSANISGAVSSFRTMPVLKAKYNNVVSTASWWWWWRTAGWLEVTQWQNGTHFLYNYAVP